MPNPGVLTLMPAMPNLFAFSSCPGILVDRLLIESSKSVWLFGHQTSYLLVLIGMVVLLVCGHQTLYLSILVIAMVVLLVARIWKCLSCFYNCLPLSHTWPGGVLSLPLASLCLFIYLSVHVCLGHWNYSWQLLHIFRKSQPYMEPVHCNVNLAFWPSTLILWPLP